MATQFRILGPVEALVDRRPATLGAPKQRALLALLLVNRRRVVPAEQLIDGLWGEEPPASALQSLQVYVHGLRRALGSERIETTGRGYRAVVAEEELDLDPCGRQADALEVYRNARRVLADDLGLEPSPALQELERAILQQDPRLAAPEAPTRSTRPLPVPPTPLVGRRLELAAVSALFRDEGARLVTLTGPGGTGKTRLGLAVAQALEPELRDGALFISLAPVSSPELLVSTIAEALDVREGERPLAEDVSESLRERRLLLALD